MRYAILSDIHANLDALETVLQDLRGQRVDRVVCLGDFVGYGPEPNECVEHLRPMLHLALVGNHDLAAIGRLNPERFNIFARMAIEWTRQRLAPSVRAYLASLPPRAEGDGVLFVHGSPRDPVEEYVLDPVTADENFRSEPFDICFFGHSHLPVWFLHNGVRTAMRHLPPNAPVHLEEGMRHLVNVGSVGQPRDGDPRAAYLIYDAEARTMELRRIVYPIEVVQQKMRAAELPRPLWARLAEGR
ncbi:MAG: metallophosphoesterase family protein [Armatimonadota bacterium]|nr:metallophosphoesterase family protein [Armatimonadota bacterium]MDR7440031.1 metallophosphoesterase family protein [Armatimonadota bacterium]MDR7562498.1 metallophosphoesterase family protein [Armatimonadota bacterium]MDR7566803.1 metallophosphoesterase family protein [Armatimonadota bacterium]MDR7601382.1 metallophosphoesterase family protein [Armatimonadota bacterium]